MHCSACANGFLRPNVDESVHLFAAPRSDSLCCCYDTDPQREVGPARMMHKGVRSVCSGPQCNITAQTQQPNTGSLFCAVFLQIESNQKPFVNATGSHNKIVGFAPHRAIKQSESKSYNSKYNQLEITS